MSSYGVHETNPIAKGYHDVEIKGRVDWSDKGLYITRLRLLSDPGFPWWDVSYCHGEINGERYYVNLPFCQLPKKGMIKEIIYWAKRDGVYAKGIGILDNISKLI